MSSSGIGFDAAARPERELALAVSCPAEDLSGLHELLARQPIALLPIGGAGDLERAAGLEQILIIEIGVDGPHSEIRWRARLGKSTPLDPDPSSLLPTSWLDRHPDGYALARSPRTEVRSDARDWDDEDEPLRTQMFIPIRELERLPHNQSFFANELVPKQQRAARIFAPLMPTIVVVPDGE
jgi:hypothetical protein